MNGYRQIILTLFCFLLISQVCFSQYILNGSAQQNSCNCYTLTQSTTFQSGSVWNSNKISLNAPFDFWFNVFLGCNDAGADGIVFILQPISTSVGSSGEGMGFGGVTPSIGIALDTYQNFNLNDPAFDHISIQANGVINHNNDLAGPVKISSIADNVEDCNWHKLRITWDPVTKWLRSYFDGVLRVEKQVDLVTSIFANDPNVYWGFTGATGGSVNLQQFCTALDPDFTTNFTNNQTCVNKPVQFTSQSESFAPIVSYNWNFGDGNTSNLATPPQHIYTQPGNYNVSLQIKGLDGCMNDTLRVISVGSIPDAELTVRDTCFSNTPGYNYSNNGTGINYQWFLDGGAGSSTIPQLNQLIAGNHQLKLLAISQYQCGLPDSSIANFLIKPVPDIDIQYNQLCQKINFSAQQNDNQTTISQWNWSFGDQQSGNGQQVFHQYLLPGQYLAKLWATAVNGCASDTVDVTINFPPPQANAGRDTMIIAGIPFQLHGSGNGTYLWSPATGLSDVTKPDPVGQLDHDQDYLLTVTTVEGCVSTDLIRLKVMEGPAIYVPTGFTPNGDGKNELLRPVYVGISQLEKFKVFNRWGQEVFSTTSMFEGWDGSIGGKLQGSGNYIWFIQAKNYLGQKIFLKGLVTLIR